MATRKKDTEGQGIALLDAMDDARAPRFQRTEAPRPRREIVEDFAEDEDTVAFLRAANKNRRLRRSIIPQTRWGRIAAICGVVAVIGGIGSSVWGGLHYLSQDARFRIASSQSIQMDGNTHVTRSQMLSIFGEDIDRNIFHVPLEQRRAEMEKLPWVKHASVMRLLPDHIRIHVVERTPVAFVRQGSDIGLVDANGVLLDIPPDAPGNPGYSFPVLTGIKADEPASTRAARMKIYMRFIQDLDSSDPSTTSNLSEVDLSDPEDIRALIPYQSSEILVHFGQENFLTRYQRFKDHVSEWRSQYPRLSGVDMRYDDQAVLQMPPGAESGQPSSAAPAPSSVEVKSAKSQPVSPKPATSEATHPVPARTAAAHGVDKPVARASASSPVKTPHAASSTSAKSTATQGAKPPAPPKMNAETARKVAAIHEWMERREKLRQKAPHSSSSPTSPASASGDAKNHPSQVD